MRVHVQSYAHHFAKRIIRECKEHVVAFPLDFSLLRHVRPNANVYAYGYAKYTK